MELAFRFCGTFSNEGLFVEPSAKVCCWSLPEHPAGVHIDKDTMVIARAATVGVVNRPWLMVDGLPPPSYVFEIAELTLASIDQLPGNRHKSVQILC